MTKAFVLVVSLLALTALSCDFLEPPPTRIPATPVPTLPPGAEVEELNIMNFQHADATVKVGTVVIWTNKDKPLHTVTHISSGGERFFNSETIAPDAGFRFHFTEPGSYTYQCLIHPVNMKGTITVTE
ncbi:MAG: plastocyanin/azurin family copper-binding protein [Chloroflexi bacterium]|nr:plastocyanin/azurin family copper-binding protein [Chloroflexota bacterium]